jgi:excisionase family DNA binding protein
MLTAQDVADVLRVPRRTVYSFIDQGLLPCRRVGSRLLRFTEEDLHEFLRRCEDVDR